MPVSLAAVSVSRRTLNSTVLLSPPSQRLTSDAVLNRQFEQIGTRPMVDNRANMAPFLQWEPMLPAMLLDKQIRAVHEFV